MFTTETLVRCIQTEYLRPKYFPHEIPFQYEGGTVDSYIKFMEDKYNLQLLEEDIKDIKNSI